MRDLPPSRGQEPHAAGLRRGRLAPVRAGSGLLRVPESRRCSPSFGRQVGSSAPRATSPPPPPGPERSPVAQTAPIRCLASPVQWWRFHARLSSPPWLLPWSQQREKGDPLSPQARVSFGFFVSQ